MSAAPVELVDAVELDLDDVPDELYQLGQLVTVSWHDPDEDNPRGWSPRKRADVYVGDGFIIIRSEGILAGEFVDDEDEGD